MDNHTLTIEKDKQILHFEVADYMHHDHERCKFEVFQDGQFVVGFEPDENQYLHICKNPEVLDEELIYLIADKIETMNL